MIVYILKTVLCSSLLYVVYHFLLEKESMHKWKRFYLLFAVMFSLAVPAITLHILPVLPTLPIVQTEVIQNPVVEMEYIAPLESVITNSITPNSEVNWDEEAQTLPILTILLICYLLITSILFARFSINLGRMVYTSSIKKNKKIILNNKKLILIENLQVPHSFWDTIFLNRTDYENNTIDNEILRHELTHIEQKHTADVLFIELLLTILWFNPALYLYRRAIKLNHEFLADQSVVKKLDQVSHYQLLLIGQASKGNISLASNFNYLITKKRLIMITKRTSRKKVLSCILLIVPLLMIFTFSFCKKAVAKESIVIQTEAQQVEATEQQHPTGASDMITPGKGTSQTVMDKCAEITDKYIKEKSDEKISWKSFFLAKEDEDYLYTAYVQMNDDQRKSQLIHYMSPLTPMKLRSPNNDEWRAATSKNNDEIWLDGKLVKSADTKKYTSSDIVFFLCRRSIEKEEGKITTRADLWTKEGYDKYIEQYGKQISTADLLKTPPVASFSVNGNKEHYTFPVRFTPPIIKADGEKEVVPPPPPIKSTVKFTPPTIKKDDEGISQDEMNKYHSILKKYESPDGKYNKIAKEITDEERSTLKELYAQMNTEQKQEQRIAVEPKMGPLPKVIPTSEEFELWKDSDTYGVWIDNKKVENIELDKYSHTDFSQANLSNLYGAAKKGKKYKIQLNLMTTEHYEEYVKQTKNSKDMIFLSSYINGKMTLQFIGN